MFSVNCQLCHILTFILTERLDLSSSVILPAIVHYAYISILTLTDTPVLFGGIALLVAYHVLCLYLTFNSYRETRAPW